MLLECRHCEALVDAKEIANFVDDGGGFLAVRYTFLKCPACSSALLARESEVGEDDKGDTAWGEAVRVFPAKDREFGRAVPKDIARAFTEARICFRTKAYTAAAIMCRKTLEGILFGARRENFRTAGSSTEEAQGERDYRKPTLRMGRSTPDDG